MIPKIIDLTHTLTSNTPTWNGSCGFNLITTLDYHECTSPTSFKVQNISLQAGLGTHIDTPAHCFSRQLDASTLCLNNLYAPCIKIDISHRLSATNKLTIEDIELFEKQYGLITPHSFVMIYTGWDKYWNSPEQYRNNLSFPTVTPEAAKLLLLRKIVGLGIDTLSPDPNDGVFYVHQTLLKNNCYIIENVAHIDQLPSMGSFILALPLKIKGLTESPIRLIALIHD